VSLTLVLINVGMTFLYFLGGHMGIAPLFGLLVMTPERAIHGWVWQFVTYTFIDLSILSLLFSSLALWSFGAMLEGSWGQRRFLELYFGSVIFAGLCAVGVAYIHLLGARPDSPVFGAWGGVMGLIGAWGTAFAEQESYMFLVPQPIKAKYMAWIWIGFALLLFVASGAPLYFAELGGALFGYLYIKYLPRGYGLNLSDRYYRLRNSYYRWKRRRAARKFEVYMRKHDRAVYFDEYGNYRPPEDNPKRGNGESKGTGGGWLQ
jgi:membrane associated rhomboid family serine protease